jgi:hypothetical protein
MKPCIYLSGSITGAEGYEAQFAKAAEELRSKGFDVLNPATLPKGRTNAQYMRICLGMIEAAHAVLLLPGWRTSKGAQLEKAYAEYIGTTVAEYVDGGVLV